MKIVVESNLHISNLFEPPLVLRFHSETPTIKDLLMDLAEQCKSIQLLDEEGRLGRDIDEISINDEDFFTFKKGINTCLNEGDRVFLQIQIVQLGGG